MKLSSEGQLLASVGEMEAVMVKGRHDGGVMELAIVAMAVRKRGEGLETGLDGGNKGR